VTGDTPLLVIDTSGDRCMVGLDSGPNACVERSERMKRGHAERLMPMVAELLEQSDVSPHALGGVVVCVGPGGFTGVRVGVAAALGIARGAEVPCIGIDLFSVLAHGRAGRVRVVQPAGGLSFFVQDFNDGAPIGPPQAAADWPTGGCVLGGPRPFEPGAAQLAAVARARGPAADAAPLYLRPPDAAPSRHQPPASLP
jgi:tRNA threonylcarbamoyl adenosine modification protein YeaZ